MPTLRRHAHQKGPIAVYGATGYTGKLIVKELVRRDLDFVLSGRNHEKLLATTQELQLSVPTRVATIEKPTSLVQAFEGCSTVINCAGPFSKIGEVVVEAALDAGANYVDTTAEQLFMQRLFQRFDIAARSAKVAVVPAVGFDYIVGDLLSDLVAAGQEPLQELVVAYALGGKLGATRGTIRSMLEMFSKPALIYEQNKWRESNTPPMRTYFNFPDPIGRQPVFRFPAGEIVTAPRHIDSADVKVFISPGIPAQLEPVAPFIALALKGASLALNTPLRGALESAINSLPEGPSEQDRKGIKFTVSVLAHSKRGTQSFGSAYGVDPYGFTAISAVHAAALLSKKGNEPVGVMAPATAFDPREFMRYLGEHNITYEIQSRD